MKEVETAREVYELADSEFKDKYKKVKNLSFYIGKLNGLIDCRNSFKKNTEEKIKEIEEESLRRLEMFKEALDNLPKRSLQDYERLKRNINLETDRLQLAKKALKELLTDFSRIIDEQIKSTSEKIKSKKG